MISTVETYEIFLYDLETTGLDEDCKILTICIYHLVRNVKCGSDFRIQSAQLIYVDPEMPFEEINNNALSVNGITKDELEYQKPKSWNEVGRYITNWISFVTRVGRKPLLIGWNNHRFDDDRWLRHNNRYDIATDSSIYSGDLLKLFRKRGLYGTDGTYKLKSVAQQYLQKDKWERIRFHEADGDVQAMFALLMNHQWVDMNDDEFLSNLDVRLFKPNCVQNIKEQRNNMNDSDSDNQYYAMYGYNYPIHLNPHYYCYPFYLNYDQNKTYSHPAHKWDS